MNYVKKAGGAHFNQSNKTPKEDYCSGKVK